MNRRTFLAAAAGAGLVGLSGCITASATQRPPNVPEEYLAENGWEKRDEYTSEVFQREFAGQTVTATASTVVYANAALSAELSEKTLGRLDGQFSTFFASRVTFDPDLTNLPGGVGREEITDRVEENARQTLEDQLEEAELENIRIAGEGNIEVDTGESARRTDYAAEYRYEPLSFPVSEDRSVSVEGGEISVGGLLAVWHHEDAMLVAGGAYPAENFERTVDEELSSAIDITVEVDLGLEPASYEAELRELVTGVN